MATNNNNLYDKDTVNTISLTTPKHIFQITSAEKYFYNRPVHSAALASYIIATPALIVKKYFSSFATAFFVGERSLTRIFHERKEDKILVILYNIGIAAPLQKGFCHDKLYTINLPVFQSKKPKNRNKFYRW